MKIKTLMSAVVFSLAVATAGLAQEIDLSLVPENAKKTIDRRSDLSPQAWRMAVFMARDGEPGHAYIALMTFREDINSFVTNGVWGLYPTGGGDLGKWSLNAVPGSLDLSSSDSKPDAAFIVWINPEQFHAIEDIASGYNKEGKWQLLFSDCVSLMADSARAAGLTTPILTLQPYAFLSDLMSGNS